MLDAIARSDGTRASVARAVAANPHFDSRGELGAAPVAILRAQRGAGSRVTMAPDGAAVVAVER